MLRQIRLNCFNNIKNAHQMVRRLQATTTNAEEELQNILATKFPKAQTIKVEDVSGGCGAMYEVYVTSEEFRGLSIVKQHQSICDALKEQIKSFHGLRIHTEIPK